MRRDDQDIARPESARFILDRFVLESPLGEGAFATVWRAADMTTGEPVVAKIAHAHHCTEDSIATVRRRFRAEYDAVSRVNHPNVVEMLAIGETRSGRPVLVMEYAVGQSLGRILEHRAPLPMKFLWPVIEQVVSALGAAHAVDVIHRDVSPDNILVAPRRQSVHVSLVDFGVARLDGLGQHTVGPIGTPGYMAPEQILGEPLPASDMFSVGALLWWALTGKEWLGEVTGPVHASLLHQVQLTEAPDPRTLRPDLDADLADLIGSLLHPSPARRPTAMTFLTRWRRLDTSPRARAPQRSRSPLLRTSPGITSHTTLAGASEQVRQPDRQWQRPETRPDVPSTRGGSLIMRPRTRLDVPAPRNVDRGDRAHPLAALVRVRLTEARDPHRARALRMASLREISARARSAGANDLAIVADSAASALPRLGPDELDAYLDEVERQLEKFLASPGV